MIGLGSDKNDGYCGHYDDITCQPGAKGGALRQTQVMAMMGFHKHNAAHLAISIVSVL